MDNKSERRDHSEPLETNFERDMKDKVAIFLCVPTLHGFNYYSFSLARKTGEN